MTLAIKVLLVTGFLGSGKTTFLNQLIEALPPEIKPAVLMNEFAEIGVDAALIERHERHASMEVIEVRGGSIFCVCAKKEFIRALADIAEHLGPDLLLIEATGVADPAAIQKDLSQKFFQGRFQFINQICLVDAVNFEAAYHVYNAVEKQIATSDLFIINKIDLVDAERIQQVRKLIAGHRPTAQFIETTHAKLPIQRLSAMLGGASGDPSAATVTDEETNTSYGELPPDRMAAAVYEWKGKKRTELEHCLQKLPASVLRAKGFVVLDDASYLLNGVMGRYHFTPTQKSILDLPQDLRNCIVFITSLETISGLDPIGDPQLLAPRSTSKPVALMEMITGQG